DVIWRHQLTDLPKHVAQCRSADSGLVGFVLGRGGLSERLTKVFLVQSPPTATGLRSVVSLDEQIRTLASLSGRDLWRRDVQPLGQGQAKCLILNAAPEALCIGL